MVSEYRHKICILISDFWGEKLPNSGMECFSEFDGKKLFHLTGFSFY